MRRIKNVASILIEAFLLFSKNYEREMCRNLFLVGFEDIL